MLWDNLYIYFFVADLSLSCCLHYLRKADVDPNYRKPLGWPLSFGKNYGLEAMKIKAAQTATSQVVLQRLSPNQLPKLARKPEVSGSKGTGKVFRTPPRVVPKKKEECMGSPSMGPSEVGEKRAESGKGEAAGPSEAEVVYYYEV